MSTSTVPSYRLVFRGRVLPEAQRLSISRTLHISHKIDEIAVSMDYSVEVRNSSIEVNCVIDLYKMEWMSWYWNYCLDFTRAQIDLVAFAEGTAFEVILDHVECPDGLIYPISFSAPFLSGLCKSFSTENLPLALATVCAEPALFLSLSELSVALRYPNQRLHACQRAIEGLRNAICRGKRNPMPGNI